MWGKGLGIPLGTWLVINSAGLDLYQNFPHCVPVTCLFPPLDWGPSKGGAVSSPCPGCQAIDFLQLRICF